MLQGLPHWLSQAQSGKETQSTAVSRLLLPKHKAAVHTPVRGLRRSTRRDAAVLGAGRWWERGGRGVQRMFLAVGVGCLT